MNPVLGLLLHAIGGLAAASFYLPFKKVRGWNWETLWVVGGIFSWLVAPWVVSVLTVPNTIQAIRSASWTTITATFGFGALWGIGGLTFGLSMRYLGMSLGYALALGSCAAFGTLIPPIYEGTFPAMFETKSGLVLMAGVGLCLVGIAVCGFAGVLKEKELPAQAKTETIAEFDFKKGVWVALFCGILSACMAFAIAAGKPIREAAVAAGADSLWQNGPVFIVIMAGGFLSNLIWCAVLHIRNGSGGQYRTGPVAINFLLCAVAGVTWYLQFMFYGMGTTRMGDKYDFSSWTLHMAFIIVFSNFWALSLREWRGTGSRTRGTITAGISILILSTVVIGYGNNLAAGTDQPAPAADGG